MSINENYLLSFVQHYDEIIINVDDIKNNKKYSIKTYFNDNIIQCLNDKKYSISYDNDLILDLNNNKIKMDEYCKNFNINEFINFLELDTFFIKEHDFKLFKLLHSQIDLNKSFIYKNINYVNIFDYVLTHNKKFSQMIILALLNEFIGNITYSKNDIHILSKLCLNSDCVIIKSLIDNKINFTVKNDDDHNNTLLHYLMINIKKNLELINYFTKNYKITLNDKQEYSIQNLFKNNKDRNLKILELLLKNDVEDFIILDCLYKNNCINYNIIKYLESNKINFNYIDNNKNNITHIVIQLIIDINEIIEIFKIINIDKNYFKDKNLDNKSFIDYLLDRDDINLDIITFINENNLYKFTKEDVLLIKPKSIKFYKDIIRYLF